MDNKEAPKCFRAVSKMNALSVRQPSDRKARGQITPMCTTSPSFPVAKGHKKQVESAPPRSDVISRFSAPWSNFPHLTWERYTLVFTRAILASSYRLAKGSGCISYLLPFRDFGRQTVCHPISGTFERDVGVSNCSFPS